MGSAVAAKPATSAPAQGADLPSESIGQPTLTQITLPKDGHFGAVVVGDALEDQYPEAAGAWSGRIAYTVYLHVGLAKSWILQYSLPREADASAGGTVARLDAPWPYDIVRPNLAPGSVDADVLMIHGFIDPSGRFQGLSVAFPPDFPQRPVRARRAAAMAIPARHAGWPTHQSGSAAAHSGNRGLKHFSFCCIPGAGALKLRFSQRIATWHDVARAIPEGEMP